MKITFRVDASINIGTGHIMRCLNLARHFHSKNAEIHFICKKLDAGISNQIESHGFKIHELEAIDDKYIENDPPYYSHFLESSQRQDAMLTSHITKEIKPDWLVVDHYAIDYRWENKLRKTCKKIMVIDDLADRKHDTDVLIDHNYYGNKTKYRYNKLCDETTKLFLGPEYSLINHNYWENKKSRKEHLTEIRDILIFMGGSDPANITMRFVKQIVKKYNKKFRLHVVAGSVYPYFYELEDYAKNKEEVIIYKNLPNLSKLMRSSDLMIGTGGVTTLERICIGLPSIVMSVEKNQIEINETMAEEGLVYYLGEINKFEDKNFLDIFTNILKRPEDLNTMRNALLDIGAENKIKQIVKLIS